MTLKYRKYNMGSYNLHFIESNRFKTITMRMNFKRKVEKYDITFRNLLKSVLLESNKVYPTRRILEQKCEDLYGLNYNIQNILSGKYGVMSFETTFLNEKYTEEGMNEKAISFMFDILFSPNIIDSKFDFKSFELCKRQMEDALKSVQDDPDYYSMMRLFEEIQVEPLSYRSIGYLDDLKKIHPRNLYEYYLSILQRDFVDIFIIGDFNMEEMKSFITKKFRINTLKKPGVKHEITYTKFRKISHVVKEKKDLEQSKLLIACKLKNLTDFERQYVMGIYSYILGGSPDSKLFKTVREENSLCYSISSSFSSVSNLLTIKAGINARDYKKTIRLIKKEIKNMEKGNFKEENIASGITTYLNAYKQVLDSQDSIISNYVAHEYLNLDLLEERRLNIRKVKKQDIKKVAKKLSIDTIYLLEGRDTLD